MKFSTAFVCLWLVATFTACGSHAPIENPAPAPVPTTASSEVDSKPLTTRETAQKLFEQAKSATDTAEKCSLLADAIALDAKLWQARITRAESKCAPAKELLEDASVAFSLQPSLRTARSLVAIGIRTKSPDAKPAARFLSEAPDSTLDDLDLAAHWFGRLGEHRSAAEMYATKSFRLSSQGATAEWVNSELDRANETAYAAKDFAEARMVLRHAIDLRTKLGVNFGEAWLELKAVSAIAVLRNAGDPEGAILAVVEAQKVLSTAAAKDALVAERAFESAQSGQLQALIALAKDKSPDRMVSSVDRTVFAIEAMYANKCALAKSHALAARAFDAVFGDDLALIEHRCQGTPAIPTLYIPLSDDTIEEAQDLAPIDRLRARSMLSALIESRPDAAPVLALLPLLPDHEKSPILDAALLRSPADPALHLARLMMLPEANRAAEWADIEKRVLPQTSEALTNPRALTSWVLRVARTISSLQTMLEERALAWCKGPRLGPSCVPPKDARLLDAAIDHLRETSPSDVVSSVPLLADRDVSSVARLSIIHSLLLAGNKTVAANWFFRPTPTWLGDEAALARLDLQAFMRQCALAPHAAAYAQRFGDIVAAIDKRCPRGSP